MTQIQPSQNRHGPVAVPVTVTSVTDPDVWPPPERFRFRDALVQCHGPEYRAEILVDERWNGFVIPRFSYGELRRMSREEEGLAGKHPWEEYSPVVAYAGRVFVWVAWEENGWEEVKADDDGKFWLGAWEWTWMEVGQ